MDAARAAAGALEPGRSRVEGAWFDAAESPGQRANQARVASLRHGIASFDEAARALLGAPGRDVPLDQALLAVRLAPDLPYAHAALARAHWREGERGEAIDAWQAALGSLPRSREAVFWLAANLLGIVAAVLVAGGALSIALLGARRAAAVAHDLGDLASRRMPGFARAAGLAALLLVPLRLGEGPIGLALALFALGWAYGGSRDRVALAASAALLVVGLHPVAGHAGRALLALGGDPTAEAALLAFRGAAAPQEIRLLVERGGEDTLAAAALAARARQLGREEEARFRYRELLERRPSDPVLLTNAANLLFEAGQTEGAIELYERAVLQLSAVPLFFNLTQAYGRTFRMDELERALRGAQQLDPEAILELTQARDANLVLDLPPARAELWLRLLEHADGEGLAAALRARLAPGRLGRDWLHLAGAFAATALLAGLLAGRHAHSGRCARCGARRCPRCDGGGARDATCENCRRLFQNPGGTDPAMRLARLASLRRRQLWLDRLAFLLSVALPGAAGIAARRPDLVCLGALVGCFAIAAGAARHGLVPDPLAAGELGAVLLTAAAAGAAGIHLLLVALSLSLRRRA
jgi:tetratricopeptide (TPR) repeat protein